MKLPPILQSESRVRLMQGAVVGSLLTLALGFGLAGWQLASNAQKMVDDSVNAAVVSALAPICVDKFQRAAGAPAALVALKATDSWKRDSFVVNGGWATFAGDKEPNRNVAEACAKLLGDKT